MEKSAVTGRKEPIAGHLEQRRFDMPAKEVWRDTHVKLYLERDITSVLDVQIVTDATIAKETVLDLTPQLVPQFFRAERVDDDAHLMPTARPAKTRRRTLSACIERRELRVIIRRDRTLQRPTKRARRKQFHFRNRLGVHCALARTGV